MKKVIFFIICYFFMGYVLNAQIKFNAGVAGASINGSSAFIDAQSPANATTNPWNDLTKNIGKGLAWPRTDLTKITSLVSTFIITNKYDGMVVYNVGTGLAGIGNTPVTPGFYYYKNKTTNVNNGTWVRMLDEPSSGDKTYYGVLATSSPSSTDITGLTNKSLSNGIYSGSFDLTLPSDGYFTLALPASWRNPLLKVDGDDTFDIMKPVQTVVINDVNYVIWQSDVTLPSGRQVSIN